MTSMRIVTLTSRVRASVRMRRSWSLLPSTRAIHCRWWVGSRRVASSKTAVSTPAALVVTLAVSHLFRATGAGVISSAEVVSLVRARMSAAVRAAGVMS
ncbi:hypothetical protein A8926_0137 [Saccharopolyspora spinosa]|uniref:Uncharacterized protein n=1 Tax=Saccharopolyspora spinosa TaxID=60894 RepID=A0A2N3XPR2_SACSN|nr:hypothetical protein A8926_0137 [Saccharopolyspora spinosa]